MPSTQSVGVPVAPFRLPAERSSSTRFLISSASRPRNRVGEDLSDGKRNGVTGTPTLFVDGLRYDGAWDFYSLLEALERPVAVQLPRSAGVFSSLPASGGLILILAPAAGLVCADTAFAPYYRI